MNISNENLVKMYNKSPGFSLQEGGKCENVFLAYKNKIIPNNDCGYSGLFVKNNSNPYFVYIGNNKVQTIFNLNYYVPIDLYGEPILF